MLAGLLIPALLGVLVRVPILLGVLVGVPSLLGRISHPALLAGLLFPTLLRVLGIPAVILTCLRTPLWRVTALRILVPVLRVLAVREVTLLRILLIGVGGLRTVRLGRDLLCRVVVFWQLLGGFMALPLSRA